MKIAFFGSAEFALPTLELLAKEKKIKIVLVVTKPDKPAGRGLKITPTPVKTKAEQLKLPITMALPAVEDLKKLAVEKIVVVAYGKFIPAEIFDHWPCINLHPSLLPRYRGPSPLQTALLQGDKVTGITTMLISQEMDAGDILLQERIYIPENMDLNELHDRCAVQGAKLVLATLDQDIEKICKPQNEAAAIICQKITDADSKITPGENPLVIHHRVRAITGYVELPNKKRVKILKTKLLPGGQLEIITVQPEGKPKMSYTEYLKGNPEINL